MSHINNDANHFLSKLDRMEIIGYHLVDGGVPGTSLHGEGILSIVETGNRFRHAIRMDGEGLWVPGVGHTVKKVRSLAFNIVDTFPGNNERYFVIARDISWSPAIGEAQIRILGAATIILSILNGFDEDEERFVREFDKKPFHSKEDISRMEKLREKSDENIRAYKETIQSSINTDSGTAGEIDIF